MKAPSFDAAEIAAGHILVDRIPSRCSGLDVIDARRSSYAATTHEATFDHLGYGWVPAEKLTRSLKTL